MLINDFRKVLVEVLGEPVQEFEGENILHLQWKGIQVFVYGIRDDSDCWKIEVENQIVDELPKEMKEPKLTNIFESLVGCVRCKKQIDSAFSPKREIDGNFFYYCQSCYDAESPSSRG